MMRGGYVLLVTVGMLFLLTAIALGMLATGSRESLVSLQLERHARLVAIAESAVRSHLATWSTRQEVEMTAGGVRRVEPTAQFTEAFLPGDDSVAVDVHRLSATLFHVEAEAWLDHPSFGPQRLRAAVLVRVINPAATRAYFQAAVTADSARLERGVLARATACTPEDHGPALLTGVSPVVGPEAVLVGTRPIEVLDIDAPFAELVLTGAAESGADIRLEAGTHRPGPTAEASICVPGVDNWGSPDVAHPCHELRPLVYSAGPATIDGGTGRGVIVVDGDLELSGDARFHGLVVVSGKLSVRDAAVVRGAVLAGHLEMLGGNVEYDGCEIEDAASAPALDRPFRPTAGSWIPAW